MDSKDAVPSDGGTREGYPVRVVSHPLTTTYPIYEAPINEPHGLDSLELMETFKFVGRRKRGRRVV